MSTTDLRLLPPNKDILSIPILQKTLNATDKLQILNNQLAELKNYIKNIDLLLHPLTVREAVDSSGVENIMTTSMEVFESDLLGKMTIKSAQKETLGYKNALMYGFELIKSEGRITSQIITALHAKIDPENTGYRNRAGTKIVNATTGRVIHIPPQTKPEITRYMDNLIEFLNDSNDQLDPLIKMAVAHYQFEAIHPFVDGNGRTGRILMVLYLTMSGKLNYPTLFISGYILKTRTRYYQYLEEVTTEDNWTDWIDYLLTATEHQAVQTTSTIAQINQTIQEYEQRLKFLPFVDFHFLQVLFSLPFINQKKLATQLNIHPNTAAKYLNILEQKKLVLTRLIGREKIYFIPEYVKLLS
jgi:Fic family protein